MLNKVKKIIKGIAIEIAFSLFFSSFFIFSVYFLFRDKIYNSIFLINRLIVVEKNTETEDKEISFDSVKKRLVHYPYYGEVWATIRIPKVEINAVVYHGDTLDILDKGVGHFSGSYFPAEGGTVIIDGHNSPSQFGRIPGLDVGDNIIIEAKYGTFTYEVTEGKIMKATELEKINIQDDREELVLYTCYPISAIGYKTDRYVIYAKLVGEEYEN